MRCIEYNPKDANIVIGGCYNGLSQYWDQVPSAVTPTTAHHILYFCTTSDASHLSCLRRLGPMDPSVFNCTELKHLTPLTEAMGAAEGLGAHRHVAHRMVTPRSRL
jgi:hypothetical protein